MVDTFSWVFVVIGFVFYLMVHAYAWVFHFVIFAYFILMEAYAGWTVGKRLLGMRVVDAAGSKIGLRKSVIRNLLRLVDGLPFFNILGIVLIARSAKGQRFGDRVAKTFVVEKGSA